MSSKGVTGTQLQSSFPSSTSGMFAGQPTNNTANTPKASINWIVFDEQFKFVSGGFDMVGTAINNNGTLKSHQNLNITIPKNGYIYVYCNNESNYDVFFDNLQVIHNRGAVLEETHYYPFGLTMSGISSRAANTLENKNKLTGKELQSKEFSDGTGLELYDFGARMQDPQLGRWHQIDPLTEFYDDLTPYNDRENNPINNVDPTGMSSVRSNGWTDWVQDKGGKVYFDKNVNSEKEANAMGLEYLGREINLFHIGTGTQLHGDANGNITSINSGEMATVVSSRKKTNYSLPNGINRNSGSSFGNMSFPLAPPIAWGARWVFGKAVKEVAKWGVRTGVGVGVLEWFNRINKPMDKNYLYAIIAAKKGMYPNYKWGDKKGMPSDWKELNIGDVWKFGTTNDMKRRWQEAYANDPQLSGLNMVELDYGVKGVMLTKEALLIICYKALEGELPPGNKMIK